MTVTITGVVEEMLDHAVNGRWHALGEVLDDQFAIVEPDSLPYGGTHYGLDGYRALMQQISTLFELEFRVVEVLEVVRGRVRRSEVFLADTAALLWNLA